MGKAENNEMNPRYSATVRLPVAQWSIRIHGDGQAVTEIEFISEPAREADRSDAVVAAAATQLREYLNNPGAKLDFPMAPARGTAFQRRVWNALRRIAPGQTMTYGALARKLGSAPRAVGGACRANPLAIVVPCHRVVARDGLGGFSGRTAGDEVRIKQWLLKHETEKNQAVR